MLNCGVQWVCHTVNKSSYLCAFSTYPKEPAYLGLHTYQNYLAYVCSMKAALRQYSTALPHCKKQVGCFNLRVVTLVADKLETERLLWCGRLIIG